MNPVDIVTLVLQFIENNPTLTVFLISMGTVWFALYVVLQATRRPPRIQSTKRA